MEGLNGTEYRELQLWFANNREKLPPKIADFISRLLNVYWKVLEKRNGSLEMLRTLRQLMGFIPKSEKGSQEKHSSAI